jgi:uncharacterized membrane protein YiaA
MDRPLPPPNEKIRPLCDAATAVMLGVIAVGFVAYMAGLWSGAIHCGHRCYWCGKPLAENCATH